MRSIDTSSGSGPTELPATARVAVLHEPSGSGPVLSDALAQLRRGRIRGFQVDVVAGDLDPGGYALIHVCDPGHKTAATLRAATVPICASVHAALPASGHVYRDCEAILSPSRFVDAQLHRLGVGSTGIARWAPGVSLECFSPACYCPDAMPAGGAGSTARINLLYAGRLRAAGGVELLADAFLDAHQRDPRLHLVLAGSGPSEPELRRRLGSAATFLGWLEPPQLARALASADLFVTASARAPFGRIVLEAQACGLPVLAVDGGGIAELVESGRSGFLVEPTTAALAQAMRWLARRATLRERLVTGGLLAVRERTWERSLDQLASCWSALLERPAVASRAA